MTDEAMSPLRRGMIEEHDDRRRVQRPVTDGHRTKPSLLRSRRSPDTASLGGRATAWHASPKNGGAYARSRSDSVYAAVLLPGHARAPRASWHTTTSNPSPAATCSRCSESGKKWHGCMVLRPGSIQGGPERGLWRGPAHHRGRLAQGLRHRQQADDHPRRAGQRPQGPRRDASPQPARTAARLVRGRHRTQGWLFPGRNPVQPLTARQLNRACPRRCAGGRDREERVSAHAPATASPPICSSRTPIFASSRFCSVTPSSITRRSTRGLPPDDPGESTSPLERYRARSSRRFDRPAKAGGVSRPALEVADIFRGHGPAWRRANAGHVSLDAS